VAQRFSAAAIDGLNTGFSRRGTEAPDITQLYCFFSALRSQVLK